MAYVTLDKVGKILGVFGSPQVHYDDDTGELTPLEGYQELPDDDPRLLAFLNPPPTLEDYESALVAMLNTKAQERKYDSIYTAATYADSLNPRFQAEGSALKNWRDSCMDEGYKILARFQAGEIAQPSIADFLGMLPAFTWPDVGA